MNIKIKNKILPVIDLLLAPFVYLSARILKKIRRIGVRRLPVCKNSLMKIGVFPILDHYYEPQFDYRKTKQPFSQDRKLPGLNLNVAEQLKMLSTFSYGHELADLRHGEAAAQGFCLDNINFKSGDAEYWYQIIRSIKPSRIFEVGSGNSTLIALRAINANQMESPSYRCKHVCIEPYEMPWLEKSGVTVIRQKVEDLDIRFFSELEANDILFIDSSHVIRPQGDVLFVYLELLPTLNKNVIVHLHDIFTPRNYLKEWLETDVKFWNEQYLLEAFLTHNANWKIIGALNYLHHHHYEQLKLVTPFLTPEREPGSFYIQKIS
ncbi:MAG: class I SAM-dependent methyltransferase [Desulforudis sp.]|nr:MAG: class I SAM-dependent methyltransferase [Desulforudis sp.]